MKKRFQLSSLLWPALVVVVFVLPVTFQDTASFQGLMDFLFVPGPEHALPLFWQENRMVLLTCLLIAVGLYYRTTWSSFRNQVKLYQETPITGSRPSMTPLQATYYYQQSEVSCLTTWLLEMCRKGALLLQYEKGAYPWSIKKAGRADITLQDTELLDTLMGGESEKRLKAFISDPDPEARDTAEMLLQSVSEKQQGLFLPRQSVLPAWLLLLLLVGEIPFYLASLEANMPMTLPAVLFATFISIAPSYAFCYFLADFLTGSKVLPLAMMAIATFFALFGINLAFSGSGAPPYFETGFYPGMTAALLTIIYKLPLSPRNSTTFSQVIGYKKYLAEEGHQMREDELPWSVGLGVHAGSFSPPFQYSGISLPKWFKAGDDPDVQKVMKELHQTFGTHVMHMVTGEMKSSRISGTGMGKRY